MRETAGFGLYVHWPFCQAKCPYCDFNSHVSGSVDQERWRKALTSEIRRFSLETEGRVLNTIFFGGGTPSLMEPATVRAVIETARSVWVPANDMEITLEANPTSVEASRFRGYAEAGVNRVSIGVQSLRDADLRMLGRLHTAGEARRAIDIAREAFARVSFDLIYGRQNQGISDWKEELNEALDLEPDHLSLYQLTIEDGTAFGDRFSRGKLPGLPDEDLSADLYELTQEMTARAGLPAYEISNHARPGQESLHNLIYWRSGDWVGVGPGAHGRLSLPAGRTAVETHRSPEGWLRSVETAGSGELLRELVEPQSVLEERAIMGLRLREGIEKVAFPDNYYMKINNLIDLGLLEYQDDNLRTTPQGRPVLNHVLRELFG